MSVDIPACNVDADADDVTSMLQLHSVVFKTLLVLSDESATVSTAVNIIRASHQQLLLRALFAPVDASTFTTTTTTTSVAASETKAYHSAVRMHHDVLKLGILANVLINLPAEAAVGDCKVTWCALAKAVAPVPAPAAEEVAWLTLLPRIIQRCGAIQAHLTQVS